VEGEGSAGAGFEACAAYEQLSSCLPMPCPCCSAMSSALSATWVRVRVRVS
jgi:hypothetical protein